jgi:hypothetical protein
MPEPGISECPPVVYTLSMETLKEDYIFMPGSVIIQVYVCVAELKASKLV